MRTLSKFLATVGILTAIPIASAGSVHAQSTCPIGYTGPGSGNICTSVESYTCTVANNNIVTINGQNAQGSVSGGASGAGNTQTGSASNSNGAVFNFQITNTGVCTAVRTVEPTPEVVVPAVQTPVVPTPVAPISPSVKAAPTVLANTGDQMTAWLPFLSLGILGAGMLAVRYILLSFKRSV